MIVKGQMINNRYQIIKNIGEGGMANVYLAYDTILNRDVAVKILRGDLADDEKFVRRFQREAISASNLVHPNIVEMYDVGEDDGQYFIVMEYVNGKTLKSLIKRRGALQVEEAVDIMLQITSGLSCAHDSYIIHRDLKPQNILMLEDGTAKITDFGIAMALNSAELTQTNSVMGSVHYLPPEQANGAGSTIKSDIYSLGIMLYEMLTGKIPFKGETAVEVVLKQMKDPIPSVCKQRPEIPQSIENIILKCSAKNPKNRYDNVNEMHEDLKNALNSEHVNDKRLTYRFSENDVDEDTKVADLEKIEKEEEHSTGLNKALVITSIIAGVILLVLSFIVLVLPVITKTKEVMVPDVSNLSRSEATKLLEDKGLIVREEIEKRNSNTIDLDKVIKTDPKSSEKVKKGTKVTLYISLGSKQIVIDNYIGKNYLEIKAILEERGLNVLIETVDVDKKEDYKENLIISQSIEEKTKVEEGDTITLTIQELVVVYPDFTSGTWTKSKIESFCSEYGITINYVYDPLTILEPNTIVNQSKLPGYTVKSGQTLTITIAGSEKGTTE